MYYLRTYLVYFIITMYYADFRLIFFYILKQEKTIIVQTHQMIIIS